MAGVSIRGVVGRLVGWLVGLQNILKIKKMGFRDYIDVNHVCRASHKLWRRSRRRKSRSRGRRRRRMRRKKSRSRRGGGQEEGGRGKNGGRDIKM